jgi:hypothetical protein
MNQSDSSTSSASGVVVVSDSLRPLKKQRVAPSAVIEANPPRGLRGQKQKRWRQEYSDSMEDEEDPREACDCKLASQGASAHIKGDGCDYIQGTRRPCFCWCKWSSHTDECNENFKALPDVEHEDRASWLAAGYGKPYAYAQSFQSFSALRSSGDQSSSAHEFCVNRSCMLPGSMIAAPAVAAATEHAAALVNAAIRAEHAAIEAIRAADAAFLADKYERAYLADKYERER